MGVSKVNFGGDTLIDLTNDSVTAGMLAKGATAHNAAGEQIVGTLDVKGTFYVTLTKGNGNSATADKTPKEVYAAYAAGYAVYALVKFTTGKMIGSDTSSTQVILSLTCALSDSEDGEFIAFTAAGLGGPTERLQYIFALGFLSLWTVWSGVLAKLEDIPAIPTELKNPHALTIKIGSTTVTYDGSTAQTVTIDDGTEVSY